ncbi:hypothetical protein [Methylomonas sp. CM2]|uniref:hypothetical protein n=1 Tax=Methylomonas sp. CM2 TaxID=3417647 RepID=UPI003CEF44DC
MLLSFLEISMSYTFIVNDADTALAKTSGLPANEIVEPCPFMPGDLVSGSAGIAWRVTQRWYRGADSNAGKPAIWYVMLEPYGDPLRVPAARAAELG